MGFLNPLQWRFKLILELFWYQLAEAILQIQNQSKRNFRTGKGEVKSFADIINAS